MVLFSYFIIPMKCTHSKVLTNEFIPRTMSEVSRTNSYLCLPPPWSMYLLIVSLTVTSQAFLHTPNRNIQTHFTQAPFVWTIVSWFDLSSACHHIDLCPNTLWARDPSWEKSNALSGLCSTRCILHLHKCRSNVGWHQTPFSHLFTKQHPQPPSLCCSHGWAIGLVSFENHATSPPCGPSRFPSGSYFPSRSKLSL